MDPAASVEIDHRRWWRRAGDLPRWLLGAELVLLLFAGPMVYFFTVRGAGLLFPALWAFFAYTLAVLLLDPTFDRRTLWNFGAMRRELRHLLVIFGVLGTLLAAGVYVFDTMTAGPPIFLSLPREQTGL
jgi:hypothetical protein